MESDRYLAAWPRVDRENSVGVLSPVAMPVLETPRLQLPHMRRGKEEGSCTVVCTVGTGM